MSGRINRDDPAYANAMREAKAQFDAAMAKSAMKGRGRSAARAAAATNDAAQAAAVDAAELKGDLEAVLKAEREAATHASAEPETEAPAVPAPDVKPAETQAPNVKKRLPVQSAKNAKPRGATARRQQQRDPGRS